MVGLGFWLMWNPVASLLALNVFIATILLISGVFQTVTYFSDRSSQHVSGWVLANGILSLLLGIFLLSNQVVGAATLVLIFTIWILFTGIMRTVGAFSARDYQASGWGFLLVVGILGIILGIIAMINPLVSAIGIAIIVGLFFVIEGLGAIATFFFTSKMK